MNVMNVRVHLSDGRYFDRTCWDGKDIHSIVHYYTEGNGSCDCNKALDMSRDVGEPENWDYPCGDTMETVRIVVTLSDGNSMVVYDKNTLM